MELTLRGFDEDEGDVVLDGGTVAELGEGEEEAVLEFVGAGIGVVGDELFDAGFSELFAGGGEGFPDAVGADEDDEVFGEAAEGVIAVLDIGGDAEGDIAAFEFDEGADEGVEDDGGIVSGGGPERAGFLEVEIGEAHGHEAAAAGVVEEEAVHVGEESAGGGEGGDAAAEDTACAGHEESGGETVAHDVAECDHEAFGAGAVDDDEVVIVAAGFIAVVAVAGDVEAGDFGGGAGEKVALDFRGELE